MTVMKRMPSFSHLHAHAFPPHAHAHAHHPHAQRDALHRIHHHQAKLAKHHARLAQLLQAVEVQIKTGQLDPHTARVSMVQLENYVELVEHALDRVRIQGETILGLGIVGDTLEADADVTQSKL